MASIGRYEIEREIGRGSMGVVYLAHDPHVRRRVAVKTFLLPPGLTQEQERDFGARFLREAQAAGALSHPAIVTIFDADTDTDRGGLPHIVMEYVEGASLRDLMIRSRRLEPDRALAMVADLADALRVAHEEGIVHRDIKPANVLLRERDGQAKIVDFGVARMSTSELTGAGDVFGSPAFMSPEQFRGAAVDARSDLFSLATILYQILCGERPFAGDDMSSLAYSVVHTPAPPITSRLPGAPHEADIFFEKALAKDPADRFPDAGAFRDAVEELRHVFAVQATVALRPEQAARAFRLPVSGGRALASWSGAAREWLDRLRRAGPSGIRPLEGAFAIAMLVLALLPGVWALWAPGSPGASAEGVSAGMPGSGDGDAGSNSRAEAAGIPAKGVTAPGAARAGSGSSPRLRDPGAEVAPKVPVAGAPARMRKPAPLAPPARPAPSSAPDSSSAPARRTSPRPAETATEAARARTSWAPRGSVVPAPNSPPGGPEGTLASLASPMSRDPLARRLDPSRASAYLAIDARSLVKDGIVKILVDGREVYQRRLSTEEGAAAAPKKLFRRREENFSIRIEVEPGPHTVSAQVFIDGKETGHEDSTHVDLGAHEAAKLRLVAGRLLGPSVSLSQ